MILPSWQTGPSLPQETAMIDFALVWRCGRRQTESLQRQNTTSPESYVFPMDLAEFDFELGDLFWEPCSAVFAKQAMRLYAPFHKADILICHRLTVYHQSISHDFRRHLQKFMLRSPTSDVERESLNVSKKVWLNHEVKKRLHWIRPNLFALRLYVSGDFLVLVFHGFQVGFIQRLASWTAADHWSWRGEVGDVETGVTELESRSP